MAEMKAESNPRSSQKRETARFDALESKLEAIERLLKDKIIQKKREALEARGRAHARARTCLQLAPPVRVVLPRAQIGTAWDSYMFGAAAA